MVDQCIKKLRSAEEGLTLIKEIGSMNTRPCFVDYLNANHESVMRQFISEVGVVEHEFLVIYI